MKAGKNQEIAPVIYWGTDRHGMPRDVADYLYGYAVRVLRSSESRYVQCRYGKADLQEIAGEVEKERGKSLYGVKLSVARRIDETNIGQHYLSLAPGDGALIKTIFKVTGINRTARGVEIETQTVWPQSCEGWDGFFPAECLRKALDDSADDGYQRLVLKYEGPLPTNDNPCFYEQVARMATDFSVLVEAWAVTHKPSILEENHLSHHPYVAVWEDGFRKQHGNRFHHRDVSRWFQYFDECRTLNGVNEILDDTHDSFLFFGSNGKDLVTPLLEQMQQDILKKLFGKEELALLLFKGEYMRRRLAVVMERYYERRIECVPQDRRHRGDRTRERMGDRRLKVLETLIRRGATEGERMTAKAAWERITGREYSVMVMEPMTV